ncbi:hypothetical protein OHA98_42285 [Streptomyces sp. NBC_00654]|uniref:hypothetical protein n=1 Tax=Streptomyces sp. NBC_00654 TaxID=2975799 RepID=UPI00225572E0|nr:hypothetical protein [Streptomyces sp. NBC_00654]MCX4971230.1 hypothetical protein [Streptomyces sp. NBC_00654]
MIAPKEGVLVLLNARKLRSSRDVALTLVHAFVHVDQLNRKGSRALRIRHLQHEFHVQALHPSQVREFARLLKEEEAEAQHLEGRLVDQMQRAA